MVARQRLSERAISSLLCRYLFLDSRRLLALSEVEGRVGGRDQSLVGSVDVGPQSSAVCVCVGLGGLQGTSGGRRPDRRGSCMQVVHLRERKQGYCFAAHGPVG